MGLGTYTYTADTEGAITLKQARELAKHYAGLSSQGFDPITERDKDRKLALAEKAAAITFMEVDEDWIKVQINGGTWKESNTINRARVYMTEYVYPIIGHLPILDVRYEHAKKILSQKTIKGKAHLWNDSNDTAKRLRGHCENIIDKGLVTLQKRGVHPNVFLYKNNLDSDFAPPANVHEVRHRPHLHYRDLPEFIERLMSIQKSAPEGGRSDIDCFIFGMLTCTRSQCTRIADWEDIDFAAEVWTIPLGKVGKKTKRVWPIPLHSRATEIIEAQQSAKQMKGRIFSTLNNKQLHDRALTGLLRLFPDIKAHKTSASDIDTFAVFHGMRSTINGWAKENRYDFDIRELMMQHLDESSTHAAYDRENALLEDRCSLIEGF